MSTPTPKEYIISIKGKDYTVYSREYYAKEIVNAEYTDYPKSTYAIIKENQIKEYPNIGWESLAVAYAINENIPYDIPLPLEFDYWLDNRSNGNDLGFLAKITPRVPITLTDFLLNYAPSEKLPEYQEEVEDTGLFAKQNNNIIMEPKLDVKATPFTNTKDETLDLYNLLDYVILKFDFKLLTKDATILSKLIPQVDTIRSELKNLALYTPISSLARFAIHKDKKEEVTDYLKKARKDLWQTTLELLNENELLKYCSFSWSWVWFTLDKLTKSNEVANRYQALIEQNFLFALQNINKLLAEDSDTHKTLLKEGSENKLQLLTRVMDNAPSELVKALLEVKARATSNGDMENKIVNEVNKIETNLKKDIVKVRKPLRRVIL